MLLAGIYQNSIVFVMYGMMMAILASLTFLNYRRIASLSTQVRPRAWIYLLLIFLAGLILRLVIFPHFHLMYVDEPWLLEMGKNINERGQPVICYYLNYGIEFCENVPKAPGWPFLLSFAFKVFGLNSNTALYFSSVLGSLSILALFLLVFLLFKNENIALWSSFFLAFTPLYVIWSNSAESMTPSLFFVLLAMLVFMLCIKTRERSSLVLFLLLVLFASLVRFENAILTILFFLAYLGMVKLPGKSPFRLMQKHYLITIVASLLLIASLEIALVGLFRPNFPDYAIDFYFLRLFGFLEAASFGYVYMFFAALAFFSARKPRWEFNFALLSLLLFAVLYLPLYTESRMALMPGLFFIILSAFSVENILIRLKKYALSARLAAVLAFLLIFIISLSLAHGQLYKQHNNRILETESAAQVKNMVDESCYVVSEWPTVFTSISGIKGLPTGAVLDNPQIIGKIIENNECAYYFFDDYCYRYSPSSAYITKECGKIREELSLVEASSFRRMDAVYYLYRIN